jgi:3',5'-cyclic-AMP phosphodiesterase
MAPEVTTVADDEVVVHDGQQVRRYTGLAPGTEHVLDGVIARTLPRPGGELLCAVATANDVHFGEEACGIIGGFDAGPILSSAPGEPPYPEVMNAAAVAEIAALDPAVVVVKGDLTDSGAPEQYARFVEVWSGAFADRLHHVRGNHDAMVPGLVQGLDGIPGLIEVPGARLALLDTVTPGSDQGRLPPEQQAWLDDVAADADRDGIPLLVFGHHHCWDPGATTRPSDYFGIAPDDSEALIAIVARRPSIRGYFAGHTHRNRVRRFPSTGAVPFVEVACLKDYPGSWAEYRVFEGGILQVHRRVSTPEALAWSERCRDLYCNLLPEGYGPFALGALDDRCFPLPATR